MNFVPGNKCRRIHPGHGSGTVRWGEAPDEPAREDARPTEFFKLYHYPDHAAMNPV